MSTAHTTEAIAGPSITNHVLTLPHPQYTYFLTQIVHLRSNPSSSSSSPNSGSSLFVHITSIPHSKAHALLPCTSSANSGVSAEDAALDAELAAAMAAAGRAPAPTTSSSSSATPIGHLSSDFSLAMCPPTSATVGYKAEPTATPISTTSTSASTSALASSMAKRLTLKLALPQLLLSLDIPQALLPAPGRIQAPEDARALLALEKAIRDACTSVLASTPSS